MTTLRSAGSYFFMSAVAIFLSLYVSSAFMGRGRAQTAQKPANSPIPSQAPSTSALPDVLLDSGAQPVQQTTVPAANSDDFVFDPTGLRDPFKPYKAFKPEKEKGSGISDILQSLSLESVELVAVVWEVNNPRALIKDKKGATYTLKRNTKVGRNNGVVVAIREAEVVVLENLEEDGRITKQYTSIRMRGSKDKVGLPTE